MRIGIVGMGWVGSSVAISSLHAGVPTELLLCDRKDGLAEGEAMDLRHGASFYPAATVRAASIEEMREADAVVIAAGRGGGAHESRLELVRDNAAIVRDVAATLAGTRATVVVVTNPVDIMTRIAADAAHLPPARVLGTGTMLDTARLRQVLARELAIDPRSIHAYVVGEHGDSEVALWSSARAGGVPLRRWPGWDPGREASVSEEVRRAAYEIIARKGATNHAIGLVTASLLRAFLRDEQRVLTVSRVQEGATGIDGVTLSLPAVVGRRGAGTVLEPEMSDEERSALMHSADVLRHAAAAL